MFPIVEATKAGIAVGRYGDAINIAYPESNTRRGRVGKEIAQSLLTGCSHVLYVIRKAEKMTHDCRERERERASAYRL